MSLQVEAMSSGDWEQVRAIYREGIAGGQATFETEVPSHERWEISHLPFARLVARDGAVVKGWAALSPVSSRHAYAGVAETSVYVGELFRGNSIGRTLLQALINESEKNGIWALQAVVFHENNASVALHKRLGFREVGTRERIARLNGVWRDTLLLERRSNVVGIV